MKTITISLTGHRPDKLAGYNLKNDFYQKLYESLTKVLEKYIPDFDLIRCHSGMALGADTVWAYAICNAKKKYGNQIEFTADIPCATQSTKWSKVDRKIYEYLLTKVDKKNSI
jgi:uncharacterized phage-like protein YoqJ